MLLIRKRGLGDPWRRISLEESLEVHEKSSVSQEESLKTENIY
jgi:hypothetical protein